MDLNEWLVIGLGLAMGWAAVSFLFKSGGPPPREDWEQAAEIVASRGADAVDWWLVLGVQKTAGRTEVQAAYDLRVSQVVASSQTIETAPESAHREQLLAALKQARERGMAAS